MAQQHPKNTEMFFFRQAATRQALASLSDTKSLVFYCGAGVTIDRTGVSWGALIKSVFDLASSTRRDKRTQTAAVEYLLGKMPDPRQAASILVEAFSSRSQSDNEFLGTKLKDTLYEQNGWSRGYILRNLVQAAMAAALSRRVVIITTNYDVYIEEALADRRAGLLDVSANTVLPGVTRTTCLDGSTETVRLAPCSPGAHDIEIHYLHGRVDRTGHVDGQIVLTEESYALASSASLDTLRREFEGDDRGVLVVGASLTDEPLIHALALTKQRNAAGRRFALLNLPTALLSKDISGDGPSGDAISSALQLRGTHLGITSLHPLSYSQSAQFLEELRLSISAHDLADATASYSESTDIDYAARLSRWHTKWSARASTTQPNDIYRVLSDGLNDNIKLMLREYADVGHDESFRLELWARMNPRSTNRTLTLMATSTGPLYDREVLRTESIQRHTGIASVSAFLEGRPVLNSLENMGFASTASRWQSFFSMPVFVQVDVEIGVTANNSYVPAGVITLASDGSLDPEAASPSVFADAIDLDGYNSLKTSMISIGREVLRSSD